MRTRGVVVLGWVVWLGGCGLVLDLQEQDPDAGSVGMDAGTVDAATLDAGLDAGPPPPGECAIDADCVDEDACTSAERCVDGRCVHDQLRCEDGIACTVDRCDPAEGCVNEPDHLACPVPSDGDCRVARCSPDLGCQLAPSDPLCDDGFACTNDRCRRDGVCVNETDDTRCASSVAVGSACDPSLGAVGSGCTEVECGEDADCVIEVTDCVLGGSCVDSVCVPDHAADGDSCDDGLGCTRESSCRSGICVGGDREPCDDENACTIDTCVEDPVEGARCVHASDSAVLGDACDDGDPCTGPGACSADGACVAGDATCDDDDDANACVMAMCTADGDCLTRRPCFEQNRECILGGCGDCLPGFEDCDGEGGCECAIGPNRVCSGTLCTNVALDGGARDGGRPDGSRPDAALGIRDAAVDARVGAP